MIELFTQMSNLAFWGIFLILPVAITVIGGLLTYVDNSTSYPIPELTELKPLEIAALRDGRKGVIQMALFNLWGHKLLMIWGKGNAVSIQKKTEVDWHPDGNIEKAIYQFSDASQRPSDFFTNTTLREQIEGTAATHDNIKGKGNFAQTITAIKHLRRERIRTLISFTAHRKNFREFKEVAKLGQRLRVNRVWADRLIPWGSGANLREQIMTQAETKEFFTIMEQAQARANRAWFGRTEIAMLELYDTSELFHKLRRPQQISVGCQACCYAKLCQGGLKCLAYAVTGDPFKADPGCWRAV